jgi:hypothetical protein
VFCRVHLSCRIIVKKSRQKSFCKTTTIIQDKPNGKTFVIQNANEIQQKTLNPPLKKVSQLRLKLVTNMNPFSPEKAFMTNYNK